MAAIVKKKKRIINDRLVKQRQWEKICSPQGGQTAQLTMFNFQHSSCGNSPTTEKGGVLECTRLLDANINAERSISHL